MSDEPRFPPPGGEEPLGYRDAGAPVSEKPELPVPSGPVVPRGKLVIASRPDDPEVALAKAFTPPRRKPPQPSTVGIVLVAVFVIIVVAIQIASDRESSRRRSSHPPATVTT